MNPRRSLLSFRLHTLLAAMLVLGPLLGWLGPKAYERYQRWRAARETASPSRQLTAPVSFPIQSVADDQWRWESFPESDPPDVR